MSTTEIDMALTRRRLLLALGAGALPAVARPAPPLMLAREAALDTDPAGFLVSEKYDGVRAVWDGRSLRFRSGLPVVAPAWFTARLPALPLDGELWTARGAFETLVGTVRRLQPVDTEWRAVRYMVFDLPRADGPFADRVARLDALARQHGGFDAVPQRVCADRAALRRHFDAVVAAGGEGLVLHRADARWQPGRSDDVLKLKPLADAEAVVVGHVPGQGRHEGRLGALRVRTPAGVEFLLGTGFSDRLREHPPEPGVVITFAYRGLTAGGVPRFASFVRVREL